MRGRKPKPTKLKVVAGNPGKRKLNQSEPSPRVTLPRCPAHLSEPARAEWKRMGKRLRKLGLLTDIDTAAFAAYCAAWGRWVEAEEALIKHGAVVRAPKTGVPMQNPYLSIANTAIRQIREFLTEFGMSPSSRSRVSGGDPALLDPEEEARDREFFGY